MHSLSRTPRDLRALYEKRNLLENLEELQEDVEQLRQRQEQHATQWQAVSAEQKQHCNDLASMYQQLQHLIGEGIGLEPRRCSTSSSISHHVKDYEVEANDASSSSLRAEVQELLLNFRQHIERHVSTTGERLECMKSDIHRLRDSVEEFSERITRQEERLVRIEENQMQQNKKIEELSKGVEGNQVSSVRKTDLENLKSMMLDAIQSAKNEWLESTQELKSTAVSTSETLQREILLPMNLSIEELRSSMDTLVADRETNAKTIEEQTQLRLGEYRQQLNDDLDQFRRQMEDSCLREQLTEMKKLEANLHSTLQTMQDNGRVAAEKQRQSMITLFDTRLCEKLNPISKALDETRGEVNSRMEEAGQNIHSVEKRVQQEIEAHGIQNRKALDEVSVQLKLQDEKFVPYSTVLELEANLREALRMAQDDWLKASEEQKSALASLEGTLRGDGVQATGDLLEELRAITDAVATKAESTAGQIEERVRQKLESVLNDYAKRTCEQVYRVHEEMSEKHLKLVEDTMDAVAKVTQVADGLPRRVELLQEDVKDLHAALLRHGEVLNEQCLHCSLQGAFDEVKDWLQDLEHRTLSRGEFKEALGCVEETIAIVRREFIMHPLPERISIREGEEEVVDNMPAR